MSRTRTIGRGAAADGGPSVALRAIVALIPWIGLKLLVRYSVMRVSTDALVGAFAVLDLLFLALCVPWIATGRPRPADLAAVLRRSWFVAVAASLATVATNLALQVGPTLLRAESSIDAIRQIIFVALPRSAIGGVPGAILLAVAAFVAASIICILSLVPEQRGVGPSRPAAPPTTTRQIGTPSAPSSRVSRSEPVGRRR